MKKIAYIEMDFPFVTTFMAAEMRNVKQRGVPIVILPINRHPFENVQDIFYDLKDNVHYPPFFSFQVIWAFIYFSLKNPIGLFSTLWEVITTIRKPLKYVLQTWAILPKSIYCAWYILRNDVKHIHGNWAHYPTTIAYIIHKLTKVPFSFSSHAGADIYRNNDMLDKKILTSLFSFTCVGINKIFMENLLGKNLDDKVYVIYHGVDLEKFLQRPIKSLNPITLPYLLMSVGNLHKAKGFQYMIEACRFLKDRKICFKYIIVGQGYYNDFLQKKINEFGLQNEVELKGQILHKDLLEIYNRAHVFIMPSIVLKNGGRDGIPNVVIEAMGIGVPVVGSNAAGLPEAIVHEKTGLLAVERDPEKLAVCVERILEDKELRIKIVQNARIFVEDHFDREKNFEKIFDIITKKILL